MKRRILEEEEKYPYVDLGLPSGILWATMNVGATKESDYGNYYMFGMGDKVYSKNDNPYFTHTSPLPPSEDTATLVLGSPWRTPTYDDFNELKNNVTLSTVMVNGVSCFKLQSNVNSNFIIVPKGGKINNGTTENLGSTAGLWSSTPSSKYDGRRLGIQDTSFYLSSEDSKKGINVRPVKDAVTS